MKQKIMKINNNKYYKIKTKNNNNMRINQHKKCMNKQFYKTQKKN